MSTILDPSARQAAPTDPMAPRLYRVTSRYQDTRDTATLELEPVDGQPLVYRPGQFTMMHAFGIGEVPISISGDPARPGPLVYTIRDVGSVSHALVGAEVGSVIGVRGPFGTPWDVGIGRGGDVVFVAGGIGLAPLRPAIYTVLANRDAYNRVTLLYGARTPEDIVFEEEIQTWAKEYDVAVDVTVDKGQHAWRGKVGLVTALIPPADFDPKNAIALVCGPEIMMTYVAAGLMDRGVPDRAIQLTMERSMKCGIGLCGHCQMREHFICVDGPVLTYDRLAPLMSIQEL